MLSLLMWRRQINRWPAEWDQTLVWQQPPWEYIPGMVHIVKSNILVLHVNSYISWYIILAYEWGGKAYSFPIFIQFDWQHEKACCMWVFSFWQHSQFNYLGHSHQFTAVMPLSLGWRPGFVFITGLLVCDAVKNLLELILDIGWLSFEKYMPLWAVILFNQSIPFNSNSFFGTNSTLQHIPH